MDAVEFIKEYRRMEKSTKCEIVTLTEKNDPVNIVAEVEKWAKEHPVKTRQSELLKLFPESILHPAGHINICPNLVSNTKRKPYGGCKNQTVSLEICTVCKRDFWLEEIENGEV